MNHFCPVLSSSSKAYETGEATFNAIIGQKLSYKYTQTAIAEKGYFNEAMTKVYNLFGKKQGSLIPKFEENLIGGKGIYWRFNNQVAKCEIISIQQIENQLPNIKFQVTALDCNKIDSNQLKQRLGDANLVIRLESHTITSTTT